MRPLPLTPLTQATISTTLTLAAILAAAGCSSGDQPTGSGGGSSSSSSGAGGEGGAGAAVCAQQHPGTTSDGDHVAICDALFDAPPYLRPPADVTPASGPATLFGAIGGDSEALPSALAFYTRDGVPHLLVDGAGKPITLGVLSPTGAAPTIGPAGLRMMSNRDLHLVYRVTGTIGSYQDQTSSTTYATIHLDTAEAAALVPGKLIDTLSSTFAWEGTVSRRLSDSSFDPDHTVPLRITFSSLSKSSNVVLWDAAGPTWPDGEIFSLDGVIENMNDGAVSATGACFPPLSALGAANPFQGAADAKVSMYRITEMHGMPTEREVVLVYPAGTTGLAPSGMTGLMSWSSFHPAGLLASSWGPMFDALTIYPHGTPNGQITTLAPVHGGGGSCNAP